jgi:hypothetical protein
MSFEDDKRFEDELRRACRADDPGDVFTQRVLDRLKTDAGDHAPASGNGARASRDRKTPGPGQIVRMALPFAASLAIAVGGAAWVRHARYVEEGQRARAQVLTALRLTSEKLNVVRTAVIESQEPR